MLGGSNSGLLDQQGLLIKNLAAQMCSIYPTSDMSTKHWTQA